MNPDDGVFAGYQGAGGSRTRSYALEIGCWVLEAAGRLISRSSLVPDSPSLDASLFSWTESIANGWSSIRREAEAAIRKGSRIPSYHEVSPEIAPDYRRTSDDRGQGRDDSWRAYFLWAYGERIDHNCATCPETARLVEQIPGVEMALYSILDPHTQISRHRGVLKGLLTYHLGLVVPGDRHRCQLELQDRRCSWEPGRGFVFDDTYPHAAWNYADELRIVLIVQFLRPTRLLGRLTGQMLLGFVRHSRIVRKARARILAASR